MRSSLLVFFGLACTLVAQGSLEARLTSVTNKARAAKVKVGAVVLRADDGRAMFSSDPDLALIPASNQKVLTCAAAVLALGMEAEIRTEFFAHGGIENGELSGYLRVRGEGDPTFGAQDFGDSLQALRAVADRLAARGLKRISGDLVLDDSAFDSGFTGPDWPDDASTDRWMAPSAALSLDEALTRVVIRPGRGDGAEAEPSPDTGFVKIVNRLRTVRAKKDSGVGFERMANGDLLAKGAVFSGAGPVVHEVAVADPVLQFGFGFRRALADAGIKVGGTVRRAVAEERTGGEIMVVVRTPLSRVFPRILKHSQNHRADMVFRHLAYKTSGQGSYENGGTALLRILKEAGVSIDGLVAADGCGLSRKNRVTAMALAGALRAMDSRPEGLDFRNMLAEPQEEGTLERRLPALKDRMFAKTGSIDGVASLSGFLQRADGWTVFAIVLNGSPKQGLRKYADDFAEALAKP